MASDLWHNIEPEQIEDEELRKIWSDMLHHHKRYTELSKHARERARQMLKEASDG